jgi:hypothetical protein
MPSLVPFGAAWAFLIVSDDPTRRWNYISLLDHSEFLPFLPENHESVPKRFRTLVVPTCGRLRPMPPRTGDHLKTIHSNLPPRPTITTPWQRAAELAPPAQRLPSEEASGVSQESLRGLFDLFTEDQVLDEQIPVRAKAPQQMVPPQAPNPRIAAKARAMQRGDFKTTARSPERAGIVVTSQPEYPREAIQADERRVRPDDGLFGLFGAGRNTWDHERND